MKKMGGKSKGISSAQVVGHTVNGKFKPTFEHVARLISLVGHVVDVNYPDRSATTILAGGSGE
jgi:hypothetical protein